MPRIIRVLSRLPTAFRMAMHMVLRREDSGLVCRLRMHVKDPRFLVVDPDDGVRHDLILSAKPIVELKDGRCYRVGVLDDAAAFFGRHWRSAFRSRPRTRRCSSSTSSR